MTEEEFLKNYDSNQFFKPSVTVDSIIFTIRDVETDNYRKLPEKKLQVLLVKRAEHPYMGKWSLPGTFVRKEERFEEAVQRSLKAKTNMQDIYLEQLYSWGDPNRDPRTRIISTSYMGLVDSEKVCIKSGGSTQDANWFTVTLKSLKEKMTENKHGYKKEEEIEILLESKTETVKNKVKGITDRNYITNSYHVPVFEEIDAFSKLKLESEFQVLSPGGAISYVETPNLQGNIDAVIEVIQFIYDNIMYAELNTKSDYCQQCGYTGEILIDDDLEWYCPNCGNRDHNTLNVARRTCGYIGTNFWNKGRTQEIKERVLHIDNKEA